ncbi:cysteine hydrolase family protein [Orbus sturtevantii]|uniref:cysteine hydrolase family protein n=1 Tax=Orbus sturtevantii TaxID=3074109 RepID=UPI00370D9EC8
MKQALLIIDIQNDYFSKGKMPLVNPDTALNNTLKLQSVFRGQNMPIFYIQHIKQDLDADFFAIGSQGAQIHDALLPIDMVNERVIIKHYPNSFINTCLQSELEQMAIKQLVICGMMTHMCIDSTTRQAAEFGYKPILIADACATRDLVFDARTIAANDVQNAFLAALSNFSQVIDTNQYLLR